MNCYINEHKFLFLFYRKFILQSINNLFNSLQFIINNYKKITKKYN